MSEKRWSVGLGMLLLLAGLLVGCGGNNSEEISPTASFTASPSGGEAPLTVVFDASGSSAAGGSEIVSYAWDFDDGTTGTGITITHSFEAPGNYNVSLEVTDNRGLNASTGQEISVGSSNGVSPGDIDSIQFTWRIEGDGAMVQEERVKARNVSNSDPLAYDLRWEMTQFTGVTVTLLYMSSTKTMYLESSMEPGVWEKHTMETHSDSIVRLVGIYVERLREYVVEIEKNGREDFTQDGGVDEEFGIHWTLHVYDIVINRPIPDAEFLPPPEDAIRDGSLSDAANTSRLASR